MIQQVLVASGCRPLLWQEWLAAQASDPVAAAAQLALSEARTQRTAAILLDQYHGALGRAMEAIHAAIGQRQGAAARGRSPPSWPARRWAGTWSNRGRSWWQAAPTWARAA